MKKSLMILAAIYSFSAFTQADTKSDFVKKYTQMKYKDMNNHDEINSIMYQFQEDYVRAYPKNIAKRIDNYFLSHVDRAWNLCGKNEEEIQSELKSIEADKKRYNEAMLKSDEKMMKLWKETTETHKKAIERRMPKKQQCETSVYDLFVKPVLENKDLEGEKY